MKLGLDDRVTSSPCSAQLRRQNLHAPATHANDGSRVRRGRLPQPSKAISVMEIVFIDGDDRCPGKIGKRVEQFLVRPQITLDEADFEPVTSPKARLRSGNSSSER